MINNAQNIYDSLTRHHQVVMLSQRGRAMLRVCRVSFNSTICRAQSFIISYFCLDLTLRTIRKILFCFLLFSSSWSSMLQSVIHKIHWCLTVCAINCTVDRRNCCLHCSKHWLMARYSSKIAFFCLAHLHSTPPFKGTLRRRIAYIFFGPPGKYILWNIFL